MAILKIARMGHPVLRQVAVPVEDPGAPALRRLIEDMIETMRDAQGTGLAAPQVHVPRRVVVFFVAASRMRAEEAEDAADEGPADDPFAEGVPLTVLINPEVEPLGATMRPGWEACLSVPELAGEVPRYTAIRYRGLDPEGQMIEREANGFHARVVQHECDHLDGILYPQRMIDLKKLVFASELRHMAAAEAAD